ncbi:MAG TPA: hypothetical protein VN493_03820 [Thermoanaerobaculia bacterium]|nr:hypothetical protein [Thermoanaerobaculia bacterium]
MSIHDFHSKLMSGKEEGVLFEALRRVRGIAAPALAAAEGEPGNWGIWMEDSTGASTAAGWGVWQEGESMVAVEA